MKPISFLFMLSVSLCASLCCSEPENPGVNYTIENNNLIRIGDNTTTFNLNDEISVVTTIANQQTTTAALPVNITDLFYTDVVNESVLYQNLTLYKETGFGTLSKIAVTSANINISQGFVESINETIEIKNVFNAEENAYQSKFKITLKEPGTFYLASSRFTFNELTNIQISGGIYELGFLTLFTSILNANAQGGYKFVVN